MEDSRGERVQLDAFEGPLDLLLHLIKKNEVDIYDIPIAVITSQYLEAIEKMDILDVDRVGEFLVVASTLMEIKTRTLLPRPADPEEEEGEDPRNELVQQLLQYRKYREAAESLRERAEREGMSFPRGLLEVPEGEPPEPEIEVDLWQLVRTFAQILQETGGEKERKISYNERPVAEYIARIRERLASAQNFTFRALFEGRPSRSELIGLLLALLELIRLHEVRVVQEPSQGEIHIKARARENLTSEIAGSYNPAP